MLQRCADTHALPSHWVQQADDQVLTCGWDAVRRHPAHQVQRVATCLHHAAQLFVELRLQVTTVTLFFDHCGMSHHGLSRQ